MKSLFQGKIFLFFLLLLDFSFSLRWAGNTLYDLESTDFAGLSAEAAGWDLSSYYAYPNKISYCWDNYIVGGYCILGGTGPTYYGQYFYRTYSGLPGHNQVNIKIRTYTIDSWDGTTADDHFEIGVDSNNIYAFRMNGFDPVWANTDLCGTDTYKDFPPFTVYLSYPHTSGSLTLKMISCADEFSCNESLGFRDIQVDFITTPVPYSSICAISPAPISSNPCPCASPNMFMYPPNSGICVYCYATCATCNAPNYDNCLSCYPGNYLSGGQCLPCNGNCATCTGTATTCTSCYPGWFLVGTVCYPSCPPPLYSYVSAGVTYCNTPCPGQYAYWDGTCGPNCAYASNAAGSYGIYPTNVNTFLICNYPCGSSSQVLYWNGTCGSSCPSPLYSSVFHGSTFCDYQCASGQYLYWNGSCLNNCPPPLSSELQGSSYARQFCWYTCAPTQYLYWNGSCLNNCPSPLTGEWQGTNLARQFCWYTCPPTQYLYWNGSCLSTCPSPLTGEVQGSSVLRNFCWYTCPPTQFLYWNGSCLNNCPSPLSGEMQGTNLPRQFCWYTCQPGDFLYWNGSCLSTCPSPLSGETQGTNLARQFCWYTCQPTEYLYFNKSCIGTCEYPLTGETQGTNLERNFCWYPCMPWQWIYWDQTCQETCDFPLWPQVQSPSMPRNFCFYPCDPSQFLYWNGTCSSECPAPLDTRYQNGMWFCDYPCTGGDYLYWNGSCIGSCPSPLYGFSEGTPSKRFCYYLCQVNEFLYWDGSCQSDCSFPLVPNIQSNPIRQFCYYLCPTSQFLYWNGTCLGVCDPPLTQRVTNSRNFCDHGCNDDQYLAWNGTCLDICPYPLNVRAEGSPIKKTFCDYPCSPLQYLYWNGSCLSTCDSPLSLRIEGSPNQRRFCNYPCVGNQYLYWNGTCSLKCNLPLVVRIDAGNRFCDYLCPAGQIMYWDGTCGTSCNSPLSLISQGSPVRQYCQYKCAATQFLYWNGSCADKCDFPLTSTVLKARLFCQNGCTGTNYLYFNGSCLGSCPLPWSSRVVGANQYCDYPCVGDNKFLYWNGSCLERCDSPLSQRTTGGYLYCDFSCSISTDFLYWNGTCSSQCPYPLSGVSEGASIVRKFCRSGCLESQFLYWNQTCSNKCDFPLIQANYGEGSMNYCLYPCGTNEYLYWNGSCLSSCNLPLSLRNEGGLNYCDYPCSESYLFLYWNGSCLNQCDSPLTKRTENYKNYCDFSCSDSSQYLYYDKRCSSECTLPLKGYQEGTLMTRQFCLSACEGSDYIYWNGSCLDTCPSPLTQIFNETYKYCNPPCSSSSMYYYEELKACADECHMPGIIDNDLGYLRCLPIETVASSGNFFDMFLLAPLESGTWTIVKLVKIMQYVKYLDIHMPPRLQRLGISKGRNVMSVNSGVVMGDGMKKDFFKQALAYSYEKNRLHSSFLVNFWEDLTTLMIAFVLACVFFIGERLSAAMEWKLAEIICHTLRVLAKWNAVIMFLAINLDDIILFSAVEFKSLNLGSGDSGSNSLSFAMAFVFIGSILILSAFIYLYARRLRAKRIITLNNPKRIIAVNESFQILFRGYRDNNIFNQLFFMIYMFRIGVPMLVAVLLEMAPIAITILEVLISLGILTYLLKMKPFIKKINHQQIVFFEVIVLIMNFCMFILTILSMVGLHHTRGANILGDIVIIGNDIINVMCLVFLVIKLYIEAKIVKAFVKKNSIKKAEATGLYLQLLFVPLQLGNMGFEEMIAYDIPLHEANVKSVKFRKGLPDKQKKIFEEQETKRNISFEFNEAFKNTETTARDRRLLKSDRNKLRNTNISLSPEIPSSRRFETFGEALIISPSAEPMLRRDLESPSMIDDAGRNSPILVKSFDLNEKVQNNDDEQVFIDVDFPKIRRKKNRITGSDISSSPAQENNIERGRGGTVISHYDTAQGAQSERVNDNSDNNQDLSLQRITSQELNLPPHIIRKLNRKKLSRIDENNNTSRFSPGSLIQQDLEEFLRDIRGHNNSSRALRDPAMRSMGSINDISAFNNSQSYSPGRHRGRIYDFGDSGFEDRGHSLEDVRDQRKHLSFRESSVDFERRENHEMGQKKRMEENVMMRLWRSGKRHFKPNYKE